MKRKERDEDAEADQQEDVGTALRSGGDQAVFGEALQLDEVEGARSFRHGEVEIHQADQQDEAAEAEIDRDLPGRRVAFTACPTFR